TVARMNCARPTLPSGRQQTLHVEITLRGGGTAKVDGLVRLIRVTRLRVGVGVNRDRSDAEATTRTDDAHRNLAAVRDQNGFDHILKTPKGVGGISAFVAAESPRPSTRRVSTGSITPSSQRRAV